MFTCLCIPTHKRTHTHTHKHTHMHIQSYMHTYIDQYPYTYVYVYAHIQSVYMYMCIYTCISTHPHMHVYIHTHTHTYTCACIGVEMFAWGRFVDTGGRACLWKCQRVGFEPWSIWRTGAAGVACDAVCLHMWVYDPNTSKFAHSIMCAGLEVCGSCECLCMCAHMCLREREYTSSLTHAHTEGKIRQGARPLAPCSWQTQTHTHTHTHKLLHSLSPSHTRTNTITSTLYVQALEEQGRDKGISTMTMQGIKFWEQFGFARFAAVFREGKACSQSGSLPHISWLLQRGWGEEVYVSCALT